MLRAAEPQYERALAPNDLLDESELVVRGSIVAVREGPTLGPSPELGLPTAVFDVEVDRVLFGDTSLESSTVELLVMRSDMYDVTALAAELAEPVETLLYLSSTSGWPDQDVAAPTPRYWPAHPQGFVVDTDDGAILALVDEGFDGLDGGGHDLEDFAPESS